MILITTVWVGALLSQPKDIRWQCFVATFEFFYFFGLDFSSQEMFFILFNCLDCRARLVDEWLSIFLFVEIILRNALREHDWGKQIAQSFSLLFSVGQCPIYLWPMTSSSIEKKVAETMMLSGKTRCFLLTRRIRSNIFLWVETWKFERWTRATILSLRIVSCIRFQLSECRVFHPTRNNCYYLFVWSFCFCYFFASHRHCFSVLHSFLLYHCISALLSTWAIYLYLAHAFTFVPSISFQLHSLCLRRPRFVIKPKNETKKSPNKWDAAIVATSYKRRRIESSIFHSVSSHLLRLSWIQLRSLSS